MIVMRLRNATDCIAATWTSLPVATGSR